MFKRNKKAITITYKGNEIPDVPGMGSRFPQPDHPEMLGRLPLPDHPGMWGRFPPPGQMMNQNHPEMWGRFPPPGQPFPPPHHPGICGRFPNPDRMMNPNQPEMCGRFPNPSQMMNPNQPDMWQRFPHPEQMNNPRMPWQPHPVNNMNVMNPFPGSTNMMNPPNESGSSGLQNFTGDGSKSSPRKGATQVYQEPDSSTSSKDKRYSEDEEEEETKKSYNVDYADGPFCEVCQLHLQSEHTLWRHMSGKKHMKALKAMESGKPLPKRIQGRMESAKSDSREEISSIEKAFAGMTADEPVIGLGFVVETYDQAEELFTCELCDARCNQNNMVLHVIGLKHRMAYLKKCDPERYSRLKKQQKRSKMTEDTRKLCKEVESSMGRGQPRYIGPKLNQAEKDSRQYHSRNLSEAERRLAMKDLKCTLLQDFERRNLKSATAQEMLEERLELLKEYERRGVPFDIAKERVIEDEDRWNLLLEFERQTLSFDEAEERISYRMDLLKAYQVNGCPKEEARKKVLDDEVIRDFRKNFQHLGFEWKQAQKQVEKRLWMLERLHYQGFSQEEASRKVMKIERELYRCLQHSKEGRKKDSTEVEIGAWMKASEKLEDFIANSFYELGLSSELREKHIKLALDCLDNYKKKGLLCDEAKKKVLGEDLPIPEEDGEEEESSVEEKDEEDSPVEMPTPSTSSSTAGSMTDIAQRVILFMSKMHAALKVDKESPAVVDREKQLALFDQLDQLELQSLLSDMLKAKVNAHEAKNSFVVLFQQHENLRNSLFPFTCKNDSSSERLNAVFKMFLQHYDLSKDEQFVSTKRGLSKDKSPSVNSPKHRRERSRGRDNHGHSSRKRSRSSSRRRRSRSHSPYQHSRRKERPKQSQSPSASRRDLEQESESKTRKRSRRDYKHSPSHVRRQRVHPRERERSDSRVYSQIHSRGRERSGSPLHGQVRSREKSDSQPMAK